MMASSETDQLINKNPVINLVSYGTDGLMQVRGGREREDEGKRSRDTCTHVMYIIIHVHCLYCSLFL